MKWYIPVLRVIARYWQGCWMEMKRDIWDMWCLYFDPRAQTQDLLRKDEEHLQKPLSIERYCHSFGDNYYTGSKYLDAVILMMFLKWNQNMLLLIVKVLNINIFHVLSFQYFFNSNEQLIRDLEPGFLLWNVLSRENFWEKNVRLRRCLIPINRFI